MTFIKTTLLFSAVAAGGALCVYLLNFLTGTVSVGATQLSIVGQLAMAAVLLAASVTSAIISAVQVHRVPAKE